MHKFEGAPEHDVSVRPHGSSKCNKPYCRTMKSVQKQLAKEVVLQSPKEAIRTVFTAKGGLKGNQSQGSLPLNPKQAYNISQNVKKVAETQSKGKGRDLLFLVMDQCKSMEKQDRFVQEVTCAPEPMAILATEQQLHDLERFCCNSSRFSVMGIDPTFNLGDFNVTPIVYQHLMVRSRQSKSYPWMLGPLFIHYRKEFRNYNFFLSSLVGLRRGLAAIQAAGTDGEKSIIEALKHQFKDAILLRCFRHL